MKLTEAEIEAAIKAYMAYDEWCGVSPKLEDFVEIILEAAAKVREGCDCPVIKRYKHTPDCTANAVREGEDGK